MVKRLTLFALALILVLTGCSPAAFPNLSTPTLDTGGYAPPPETQPPTMNDPYPIQQNGTPQGGARSLYPPTDSDQAMVRGNFFVDAATLQQKSDEPGMVNLFIEGSLPTPCHQPRAQVNPPDASNKIVVDVYSVAKPDEICTQVLEPFNNVVAVLGGYPAGTYSVEAKGQVVGEITVP